MKMWVSGMDCRMRLTGALAGALQQSENCRALERAWVARECKCWAPERAPGARLSKPAVGSKFKWSPKWCCSGADYFKICENDILRIRNLGLKIGALV